METEINDSIGLSSDYVNEMEAKRIRKLDEAGINEKDVLEQANKRLNSWNSYFNENITRGKDDMNFCLRDQWTAIERSEFTRLFKPAMTFNKLYDATKKIAGEQRKNKPDLIVRSLTGKATQEQINLRSDLVRTISYQSQNDLVYQTAFNSALMMGFGAFQIVLDYESPTSFNQSIRYDLISDPTRTAFDPTAVKPHKGDGNYCARYYVFSREEFEATYPYITNPVSYIDPYMLLDFQWQTQDTITVCDYFVKEWFPLIIYKLSDGRTVTEDEWEEIKKTFEENKKIVEGKTVSNLIELPKIVNERQTQDYIIMHYRMLHNQIIEFSKWPSKYLPIIFVDGDSHYIEGRQYTKSFIHEARDAQKCVNYFGSEIAAEVKNRRREQWLGTPDNIIGYEKQWRNPETQNGILLARPDPKTGMMPTKQQAWDLSPAIMANFQRSTQDIKEILGFSETEAIQGRDISGKARRERKLEGSMSAYVYFDNLNQAIEQSGRVVNDLLDHTIGLEERWMIVARRDGKSEAMIINQRMPDGTIKNQIGLGDFDIEIDTGPSFAVQKDIALEFFQQTIANQPQVFNLIADLWASQLDIQQVEQVKERLKTLVPPQILAQEQGKQLPPQPPTPQEQMMQLEMQTKMGELQAKMQKIQQDQEKLELEKQKMVLQAREMQMRFSQDERDHLLDVEKAKIDHYHALHDRDTKFTSEMTKIMADLYKDGTSKQKAAHS